MTASQITNNAERNVLRSWAWDGTQGYAGETTRDVRAGVFCPCGSDVSLEDGGAAWLVKPCGASSWG